MTDKGWLLLSALVLYAIGVFSTIFYVTGMNPNWLVGSAQSYYLGVLAGMLFAGFLLVLPALTYFVMGLGSRESVKDPSKKGDEK